jgi:hypothetical protein
MVVDPELAEEAFGWETAREEVCANACCDAPALEEAWSTLGVTVTNSAAKHAKARNLLLPSIALAAKLR